MREQNRRLANQSVCPNYLTTYSGKKIPADLADDWIEISEIIIHNLYKKGEEKIIEANESIP